MRLTISVNVVEDNGRGVPAKLRESVIESLQIGAGKPLISVEKNDDGDESACSLMDIAIS
jgi:nitrogen-specific signal transduction histidine kinase